MTDTAELVGALFAGLTNGDPERVAAVVEGLSGEARAALRKAHLKEVRERLREWRSFVDPMTEWRHPEEYRALRQKLGPQFPSQARKEAAFSAHRLAVVGLAARGDVEQALLSPRMNSVWSGHHARPEHQFFFRAGILLAKRDEPWAHEVLLDLLDFDQENWWAAALYCLGRWLLEQGAVTEAEALPRLSRQARRLRFDLWEGSPFQWDDLGRKIAWAALEDRHEPFLAAIDFEGKLVQRVLDQVSPGHYARRPLLQLALRRLAEGSRAQDVNWWARLLEMLKPTNAEWLEQSEAVLDLIGAPSPRAVSVGLSTVAPLLKSGVVEPAILVPVLSLAVTNPAATSAKTAVTLLSRCAGKEPTLREEALTAALVGLQHPKPAVHDAVFKWLETDPWWRDDPEALYAVLNAQIAVAPAVAARLKPLLPDEAPAAPRPGPAEPENAGDEVRSLIHGQIAAERDDGRRKWLEAVLWAFKGTGPLPQPRIDYEARWRLDAPFEVPGTLEETAGVMLRVTVAGFDHRDWERICAGVRRRVTPEGRKTLARHLDPVLKLRSQMDGSGKRQSHVSWQDAWPVLQLAEAWLGLPSPPFPSGSLGYHLERQCSRARRLQLDSAIAAIYREDGAPALGTPTHASGWLDPAALADRLIEREDLPAAELWELSAALYRLPRDPAARAAAWTRLAPKRGRFGELGSWLVTAALDPGCGGDQAAVELIRWFSAGAGRTKRVQVGQNGAHTLLQWIAGATGASEAAGLAGDLRLRLLTSALFCRHGAGGTALEALVPVLPAEYEGYLERFVRYAEGAAGGEATQSLDWLQFTSAAGWYQLADLLPELRPYVPAVWGQTDAAAFACPAVAPAIAESLLRSTRDYGMSMAALAACDLLRRPYCPVTPSLGRLIAALPLQTETATAVVDLLAVALRDGRLRLHDLIVALGPAIRHREMKPRALLNAMELLARQYPAFAEAAAVIVERALAEGMDAVTPGDRILALELLLAGRAASGHSVEDPAARRSLEALAAKNKSSRAGILARQLLDLPARDTASSVTLCLTHDIRVMLGEASTAA